MVIRNFKISFGSNLSTEKLFNVNIVEIKLKSTWFYYSKFTIVETVESDKTTYISALTDSFHWDLIITRYYHLRTACTIQYEIRGCIDYWSKLQTQTDTSFIFEIMAGLSVKQYKHGHHICRHTMHTQLEITRARSSQVITAWEVE